jgi:hypothetical protein
MKRRVYAKKSKARPVHWGKRTMDLKVTANDSSSDELIGEYCPKSMPLGIQNCGTHISTSDHRVYYWNEG